MGGKMTTDVVAHSAVPAAAWRCAITGTGCSCC